MQAKRKIYTQLEAYESSDSEEETKRQRVARALPLVEVYGDRLVVGKQAVEFLRDLRGPIAVVSVMGKWRTGPTF